MIDTSPPLRPPLGDRQSERTKPKKAAIVTAPPMIANVVCIASRPIECLSAADPVMLSVSSRGRHTSTRAARKSSENRVRTDIESLDPPGAINLQEREL
jgi:hypothetical protein